MIGYKVVTDTLTSTVMRYSDASRVQYIINEAVYPNPGCGPLTVFEDLYDALSYAGNNYDDRVFSCEFEPAPGFEMFYHDENCTRIVDATTGWLGAWPSIKLASSVTLRREIIDRVFTTREHLKKMSGGVNDDRV